MDRGSDRHPDPALLVSYGTWTGLAGIFWDRLHFHDIKK
jgi:hypothetical protein